MNKSYLWNNGNLFVGNKTSFDSDCCCGCVPSGCCCEVYKTYSSYSYDNGSMIRYENFVDGNPFTNSYSENIWNFRLDFEDSLNCYPYGNGMRQRAWLIRCLNMASSGNISITVSGMIEGQNPSFDALGVVIKNISLNRPSCCSVGATVYSSAYLSWLNASGCVMIPVYDYDTVPLNSGLYLFSLNFDTLDELWHLGAFYIISVSGVNDVFIPCNPSI